MLWRVAWRVRFAGRGVWGEIFGLYTLLLALVASCVVSYKKTPRDAPLCKNFDMPGFPTSRVQIVRTYVRAYYLSLGFSDSFEWGGGVWHVNGTAVKVGWVGWLGNPNVLSLV